MRRLVAVVGPGDASPAQESAAEAVGRELARRGVVVVTGGLGGVMAAASRGAATTGGDVVAFLPGSDRTAANPWASVVVPTGLGEARDALVVAAAEALVVVGGSWGTLAEVALAARRGVPVVVLEENQVGPWSVRGPQGPAPGLTSVATVGEAVATVASLLVLDQQARGVPTSTSP